MFSFFKRSKSQKGKQKHDKLQLPPESQPTEECDREEHGPAKNAPEDVRPPAETCAKVASDAYASANAPQTGALTSHAGDEENQAKNSTSRSQPPQPQASTPIPAPVPMGSIGILAPLPVGWEGQGTAEQRQLLPSKWSASGVSKGADEANGPQRTGTISIDRVSASGPTRQYGSDANDPIHENESSPQQQTTVVPGYDGSRETSTSPIDDSAGRSRETQPNATSSNPYAPPSESAMAKGKNRRRYQQPQQQQQQQHQQHVKATQHPNGLKLSLPKGDSSGGQDASQGKQHLSNLPAAMTIVTVEPIKVRETMVEAPRQGDGATEPHLPNGDVTKPDGNKPTRTADALAKTRTNDGDESVALVSENACATPLAAVTNTSAPHTVENVTGERQLLNIKNGSPTSTYGDRHEHYEAAGEVRNTTTPVAEDRALCSSDATILTASSKPVANLTISESNAANRGGERAEPTVTEQPTIQEMGQQPSRAGSEQRAQTTARSKSSSPPLPPPRNQRTPSSVLPLLDLESATRHTTVVTIVQDAAGDDTSDDRDVFYEATETIAPASPSAPDDRRADSGTGATGTPEPIRASLVLKLANHPDIQSQQRESPQKKQVSFKLTQNGSDDVDVTSVDSSDVDSDSEEAQPAIQTPPSPSDTTPYSGNRCTAFSESHNSNPPPYGVSAFAGEQGNNYIEFQYDHSAVPGEPKPSKADGGEVEKCADKEQTAPGVLIEDSVASLPDVVQPSNIEPTTFSTVDKINSEMKDLVNQESRYSAKLEEAEKRVKEANVKVYELQQKLDAVERDALLKEYNVERLQAELVAALKECEGIRARLTTQQTEMETIRLKASDREDELNLKYQNLEIEHLELTEKLAEVRKLAHDLNSQLIDAKSEVDRLKEERQKLLDERTEEQKVMREALEESVRERAQVEAKWKQTFEQLRDVNNAREEDLMKDCEFTIRSMQKTCKEKMETVEKERKQALEQVCRLEELARKRNDEVRHLKSYEAEVEQLRGLTYDQKESLAGMTRQVESLKAELETAYNKLEEEMVKVQQIKNRCEYQLCEKEREALNRIEIARGEIAMQWEDRLLHEMNRLKVELEQTHMEERTSAIEKLRREALAETEAMSQRFSEREKQLKTEIESLKAKLEQQKKTMANAQSEADQKLLQSRMYVERAEREHERKLAKEISAKDEIIETLKQQFEQQKKELEQDFSERIQQVQEEFAREISDTTELMKTAHKKELETQWKALVAEKEEALHLMDSRNRNRIEDAENKIRELTTGHQRQLKDLQEEHTFVVQSLETRDTKNAQEIQTLHKKCRCLTSLFEEMRLRYERRESRMEDLQQIEELKIVIESQERDLRQLTEQLRELQLQQDQHPPQTPRRSKPNRGRQQKQQSTPQQQQPGNRQQQQQQLQGSKQQQKKGRPQNPPAEPQQINEIPLVEDHREVEEEIEYVESGPSDAPQVVIVPSAQVLPQMVHRSQCEVIYEENEADILREEEEEAAQLVEEQQQQQEDNVEDQPNVENEEPIIEEVQDNMVTVVDVPESAIQTEDRVIHSTTPTIIEEMDIDDMAEQQTTDQSSEDSCSTDVAKSIIVVPIENVTEPITQRPRASSAPRIIITDDEKDTDALDLESTVVEISEDASPVAIELAPVFAKPYPAATNLVTDSVGDSGAQAVPSTPEIVVPHLPEGTSVD
ncbi:myosin heavy chain, fast skeletal muscle isoform X1 [Anopheles stephensi]|uniref:myosin heavy chain, fast skeletal muscle isoform X1 n=1 Tax=Anopheles stephensi TaxID=30069 RepID=UPI001658BC9F|nr:myosin heavy chain, fast skeletal muscle isoform X1 [Anopheles stephensi]XP_035893337.1 myosin heavy chain, fast skeletal muscle isoform X1 [Anopheles stephensi]